MLDQILVALIVMIGAAPVMAKIECRLSWI